MKRVKVFILFSICIILSANSQNISPLMPKNGLVGWWPMEGNSRNEISSKCQIILKKDKSIFTKDRFGQNSKALHSRDDIMMFDLNFKDPFTLGFWIEYTDSYSTSLSVKFRDSQLMALRLIDLPDKLKFVMTRVQDKKIGWAEIINKNINLRDTKWHLIVLQFDGKSISLSTDGEPAINSYLEFYKNTTKGLNELKEIESKNLGEHEYSDICVICKGKEIFNNDDSVLGILNVSGYLDDVFIFDRVLDTNEIAGIYNGDFSLEFLKSIETQTHQLQEYGNLAINSKDISNKMKFLNINLYEFLGVTKSIPQIGSKTSNQRIEDLKNINNIWNKKIVENIVNQIRSENNLNTLVELWIAYNSLDKKNIGKDDLKTIKEVFKTCISNFLSNELKNITSKEGQDLFIKETFSKFSLIYDSENTIIREILTYAENKNGKILVFSNYLEDSKSAISLEYSYLGVKYPSMGNVIKQTLNFSSNNLEGTQESRSDQDLIYQINIEHKKPIIEKWFKGTDLIVSKTFIDGGRSYTYEYDKGRNLTLLNLSLEMSQADDLISQQVDKNKNYGGLLERIANVKKAKELYESIYARNYPKDLDIIMKLDKKFNDCNNLLDQLNKSYLNEIDAEIAKSDALKKKEEDKDNGNKFCFDDYMRSGGKYELVLIDGGVAKIFIKNRNGIVERTGQGSWSGTNDGPGGNAPIINLRLSTGNLKFTAVVDLSSSINMLIDSRGNQWIKCY